MNYRKIYDSIIERAKTRKILNYKEKHHIIPKCLGGNDNKENIVCLTAREHFICHWLLHNIYPENDKLLFAFRMMCNVKDKKQERYIPSSRIIEYVKKEHSKRISGDKHPKYWLNKTRPEIKGKKLSNEHKRKISEARTGHGVSIETREKISKANIGKKVWNKGLKTGSLSEDHKQKISKANLGKIGVKMSKETKEKIRKIQLENSSSAKKVIQKDLSGNILKIYNSIAQAKKETGFSRILDYLKKRIKHKKFIWEYND